MHWRHSGNPNHFEDFIKNGYCPVCELRLDSTYHTDCEFMHTQEWLLFIEMNGQ